MGITSPPFLLYVCVFERVKKLIDFYDELKVAEHLLTTLFAFDVRYAVCTLLTVFFLFNKEIKNSSTEYDTIFSIVLSSWLARRKAQ